MKLYCTPEPTMRKRRHRMWRDMHRRPRRIILVGACARFPARGRAGGGAVIDRDTNARANLGMRGVYATCGVDDIIPGIIRIKKRRRTPKRRKATRRTPKRRKATRRTTRRRRTARTAPTVTRAAMVGQW
ncbi:hypothetical protein JKP88DRAFT_244533 [Tribonema minus]|uniref:Uncharacterized protein n=1 Tax=Tribonema minus TaxID=303371 RepID=A0A835Z0D3_9STRA|nr:hypothetical protein JKP88DRAFT_244533 [Tribonema minus]